MEANLKESPVPNPLPPLPALRHLGDLADRLPTIVVDSREQDPRGRPDHQRPIPRNGHANSALPGVRPDPAGMVTARASGFGPVFPLRASFLRLQGHPGPPYGAGMSPWFSGKPGRMKKANEKALFCVLVTPCSQERGVSYTLFAFAAYRPFRLFSGAARGVRPVMALASR